jgi:hypothetical protein
VKVALAGELRRHENQISFSSACLAEDPVSQERRTQAVLLQVSFESKVRVK